MKGGLKVQGKLKMFDSTKPTLTVITVVKNNCELIERTIQSVIKQTYSNLEYIIIDGDSVDGTLDVIKKYDEYIDFWISESDTGVYDAMNKGVGFASSDWLNFMNCGDVFSSQNVLENLFNTNRSQNIKFIYSDAYLQDLSKEKSNMEYWWTSFELKSLLHQSVIYKKELHDELGRYVSNRSFITADYFFFNLVPNEYVWKYERESIAIYRSDVGISTSPTCNRQVLCIDYLFGRITFNQLIVELMKDWLLIKKKRNKISKIQHWFENKICRILNLTRR